MFRLLHLDFDAACGNRWLELSEVLMIEKAVGFLSMVCFFLIVSVGFSLAAVEGSAIVEKHIFSPEPDSEKSPKTETTVNQVEDAKLFKKLDQQLLFTGIVRSDGERKVLIREKRSRGPLDDYALSVGDEILEMTVKEIGRNYVVLSGQGGEVRLNLFKSRADRPVAPKVAAPSPQQTLTNKQGNSASKGNASAATTANRNPEPQGADAASAQPSAIGRERPADGKDNSATVDPTHGFPEGSNPFLEAIKRARERQ